VNQALDGIRVQIGIDPDGHPYALIGHDVAGTPAYDTYTATTVTLVAADQDTRQSMKVTWNETTKQITFTCQGLTEIQDADTKFDQTITDVDVLQIGHDAACDILSQRWNQDWYIFNAQGDDEETMFPDLIGDKSCYVEQGDWVVW
jgi:hypothetical protein